MIESLGLSPEDAADGDEWRQKIRETWIYLEMGIKMVSVCVCVCVCEFRQERILLGQK